MRRVKQGKRRRPHVSGQLYIHGREIITGRYRTEAEEHQGYGRGQTRRWCLRVKHRMTVKPHRIAWL